MPRQIIPPVDWRKLRQILQPDRRYDCVLEPLVQVRWALARKDQPRWSSASFQVQNVLRDNRLI